jgi:multiple sugar transport system permease protein
MTLSHQADPIPHTPQRTQAFTRLRRKLGHFAGAAVLLVFSLWILLPIGWAVTLSLKSPADILTIPNAFIFTPTLENYFKVFQTGDFTLGFANSLIIGLASTALALVVGVPAAYSLQRFRFRGRNNFDFWVLSTRMAPSVALLIPYFILFQRLGLTDTRIAIVIMHLSVNLVLVVWLMKGFFADIPEEITEAALVDGCTHWGTFLRINVPLAIGGIAATAILAFMFSWNELMFALILSGRQAKTAPVSVINFIGFEEVAWGPLMAATIVLLVPIVAFATVVQKALVRGLTFGAVKG